nr:MAG TPA: hypothetical protein [Caudoviricetes sp.]DAV08117.1 MAG TPA: hypothetical protein [Caudoviricetes sp.]DAV75917.1 MAG TPA: hypothetical protein [Caudoviricetes sp.]
MVSFYKCFTILKDRIILFYFFQFNNIYLKGFTNGIIIT